MGFLDLTTQTSLNKERILLEKAAKLKKERDTKKKLIDTINTYKTDENKYLINDQFLDSTTEKELNKEIKLLKREQKKVDEKKKREAKLEEKRKAKEKKQAEEEQKKVDEKKEKEAER